MEDPMATTHPTSIKRHFRSLPDPRVVGRSRHRLVDIIVLAICGVIGNCDDWPDIVQFARNRLAWFQRFLKLPHGVPSHDTFERVFAALDPRAFERCCLSWLRAAADLVGAGQIAIDGKTLRGSAGALRPLLAISLSICSLGIPTASILRRASFIASLNRPCASLSARSLPGKH